MGSGITGNHPDLGSNLVFRRSLGGTPDPDNGDEHENFIAGEIGAIGNNGIGVTGVLWRAHMYSAKCWLQGGWGASLFNGALNDLIAYARGKGKKLVVTTSFGANAPELGRLIRKTIQYAARNGALIISAVPDSPIVGSVVLKKGYPSRGTDTVPVPGFNYPASFPEVLAIGSVDSLDHHWLGSPVSGPQVMAASAPNWGLGLSGYRLGHSGYPPTFNPSTSFAAPIVAGIAALVWNVDLSQTRDQVLQVLSNSADPVDPTENFGLGCVNAYRGLMLARGIPTSVDKFPARPQWATFPGIGGYEYVALYWQPPSSNYDGTAFEPGDYIFGYKIYRKLSGEPETDWQMLTSVDGNLASWIDKYGVSIGTSYDYRISCMDALGQESYWTDEVQTFTPSVDYHYISGFVRDNSGNPIPSVSITVTGSGSANYLTDDNGYYLMHLAGGMNWTVTPSQQGYTFSPPSREYSSLAQNMEIQNYTGTGLNYYYIKGFVKDHVGNGIADVTVNLSGGESRAFVTDGTGYFEFLTLQGGLNYTIAPTKPRWTFSPPSLSYSPLNSNQDTAEFTGTTFHYIKGIVRDVSGSGIDSVWVTLSGDTTAYHLTQSSGYYEFLNVRSGGNYSVGPTKIGWSFSPYSVPFTPLNSDQDSVNFTGSQLGITYYIKGYVRDLSNNGVTGANVSLSGGASANYTTGSDGYYEFLNLPSNLNYTVTPGKSCWTFSPPFRSIYLNANKDNENFAGTPSANSYFIKGNVRDSAGAGVESTFVSLTGAANGNYTTDSSGYYEFLNLQGGFDYVVTPSKTEWSFVPLNRPYSDLCSNEINQDFTGSLAPPSTDFRVDDGPTSPDRGFPAISANAIGDFVTVWLDTRNGQQDIYSQRYEPIAIPLGSNFKVNDAPSIYDYRYADIAVGSDGSFVVTWQDNRDYQQYIYARMYGSNGAPLGASFRVDDGPVLFNNARPKIAVDGAGNFVIVWQDLRNGPAIYNYDIYAQRYNSSGTPIGTNFKVDNDTTTYSQTSPSVSANSSGNFVICWVDGRTPDGHDDIYCQRYNSSGTPLGSNFKVNSDFGYMNWPDISIDNTGGSGFVVTWEAVIGSDGNIYAQRYNSTGTPLGSNFKVNDDAGGTNQFDPTVAMNNGSFAILWQDYRNGGQADVFAQKYNSSGSPIGANSKVNDDTVNAQQQSPEAAANGAYIYATVVRHK
jgi:hypothetical protein